jgi:SnoaL-like domain
VHIAAVTDNDRSAPGDGSGTGRAPSPGHDAASAWVDAFAEGWRAPAGPEAFADHFEPWLDPQVRLIQPQTPMLVGHAAFRERFVRPLFALVPDLHGTVEGWASNGDTVYIELRLEGTVGRQPVTMHTCDRVELRDGVAIERLAYIDPTPLMTAIARTPRAWPRFIRQQLSARRRTR